ncbi:MAG: hypothetical protein QOF54_2105, partial [Solirubrobacteraceae bacterium]|nr:hypothetical protein [Solirubrobacteraceae bacterium]
MRRVFVLAVLAGLILAACGSSSGSSTKSTAAGPSGPTKAEFIAQADPICAAAKKR